MHTAFSLCKGCFFREQQTACRNPRRTEQNRYDKGKIWGCKSETTVSFFNLPFMAYQGKAKSLSRTHSQPLSLFHCQICCLIWGLETNDFFFFLLNELSYLGMDDGFRRYRVGYEHALLLPCGTPVLMNLQTLTQLLSQHLDRKLPVTMSPTCCIHCILFRNLCFQCLFMLSWHM